MSHAERLLRWALYMTYALIICLLLALAIYICLLLALAIYISNRWRDDQFDDYDPYD